MAESFREWGDYGEQEQWENKTPVQKIFSFRTFKRIIKAICIVLIVGIYAILAYRLITGLGVPKKATAILWTDEATAAYEESGGALVIYTQEQDDAMGKDGRFSVYSVKLIPEIDEVQLTVRYNRSTVKALREQTESAYTDEAARDAALALIDEEPFVYLLRDNDNNVYTDYTEYSYTEGLYTYVTLAFDNVKLFDTEIAPSSDGYFSPDEEYTGLIYKGQNKGEAISSDISYIYIDFYYENDVEYNGKSWAAPILIYRNGLEMSVYDYSKDLPTSTQIDGARRVHVSESK